MARLGALAVAAALALADAHKGHLRTTHTHRGGLFQPALGSPRLRRYLAADASSCAPQQFWVNYGDEITDMVVSWATTCKDASSVVKFGTSQNSLTSSVPAPVPTTYSVGSYNSPYLYHTILHNLTLGTEYYYSVGGPTSGFSPVMSFTAHPGVGASVMAGKLTFAIIGDLGQTNNSADTLDHVDANDGINAIIYVGDLSYADSDEPLWDTFQQLVAPTAARLPWMTLPGNHEDEWGVTPNPFISYDNRWRMPLAGGSQEHWYSFSVGPTHWVFASNYDDFSVGSPQYNFIVADLKAVDRTVTPWVFFCAHAPWYNSNTAHQGDGEPMREVLEPIMHQFGVDAAWFGHVHAYERNTRVYNNQADPTGMYHITIGDGGNREGLATTWVTQPSYSIFRQATYGHGELLVENSTHALWTWHPNPALESQVGDSLWIVKGQCSGC